MLESVVPEPFTATDFKEHCLKILDQVARTGKAIVVTRRGQPLVRIEPVVPVAPRSLLGTVHYASREDLIAPVNPDWESDL